MEESFIKHPKVDLINCSTKKYLQPVDEIMLELISHPPDVLHRRLSVFLSRLQAKSK